MQFLYSRHEISFQSGWFLSNTCKALVYLAIADASNFNIECILVFASYLLCIFLCLLYAYKCSSFLPLIKIFLVDFIYYLFIYLYFTFFSYFFLADLFNKMIKKFFNKLLIKSIEVISVEFPWWNIAFIVIRKNLKRLQ